MWRAKRADRLASGLALVAGAGAILALLGSGGCEALVSDTIPSFECLPGAANCPSGSVCVPNTHRCVERTATCLAIVCPEGKLCDSQTLQCAEGSADDASTRGDATSAPPGDAAPEASASLGDGPISPDSTAGDAADGSLADATPDAASNCRGITCSCSRPSDCDSGICAGQVTETSPLYTAVGAFCTLSCCTSADCPASMVCFGTGGGGDYCVMPAWIGRGTTVGSGEGGAACEGDGDCRSGLCVTNQCADTCCSMTQESAECVSGTVCRFAAFPGESFDTHETAWCGAPIGSSTGVQPCAVDGSCQSGKCGVSLRCEAACRTSADCSGGYACSYGLAPTTLPANHDIVAGCVPVTGTTPNGSGSANSCTSNSDCLSAFCDDTGHCTNVCVSDADCTAGMHCVPVDVQVEGNYSVLCCKSS